MSIVLSDLLSDIPEMLLSCCGQTSNNLCYVNPTTTTHRPRKRSHTVFLLTVLISLLRILLSNWFHSKNYSSLARVPLCCVLWVKVKAVTKAFCIASLYIFTLGRLNLRDTWGNPSKFPQLLSVVCHSDAVKLNDSQVTTDPKERKLLPNWRVRQASDVSEMIPELPRISSLRRCAFDGFLKWWRLRGMWTVCFSWEVYPWERLRNGSSVFALNYSSLLLIKKFMSARWDSHLSMW